MSYEAMHKVRASGLTDRTQVDVLEALAFFHNGKTGVCFPSTEAIARISRVNDRTVRLTLKVLHDLEFISSVQMPGQKRYFTLHLDRLPTSEAQQEPAPLQEITGGEEPAPLKEITGEGCKKLQGTPVKTYRGPLQKLTPEQVNEQVIKQVKGTRNSLPERTPLDDDQDEQKQNSQEKASRSKRIRLTIEVLPDDWREYCAKVAPEIDPDKAWEDFKDYWQVKAKDPLSADWKRTWQSNVRKLHSGPDWMKGHLMKASVRSFKNAKNVTQTAEYRERLQACCRGEGRNEKLADDGVTIIVD